MVLEQLAVTLEILESLLYFITLAIFPMCSFDCCFRWILLSSWSFPHAWSDRLLKMGVVKIEWKHSTPSTNQD